MTVGEPLGDPCSEKETAADRVPAHPPPNPLRQLAHWELTTEYWQNQQRHFLGLPHDFPPEETHELIDKLFADAHKLTQVLQQSEGHQSRQRTLGL